MPGFSLLSCLSQLKWDYVTIILLTKLKIKKKLSLDPENFNSKGMLSTVDLLIKLGRKKLIMFVISKQLVQTVYYEEVNCIEHSPPERVPCSTL
jgi:hypothetical protein